MAYMEHKKGTKGQTLYSGKNPKQQSIAERISFGTGKKNKQSPGFVDMIVNTIKDAMK